jgi:hypothetical protein
MDYRMYTNTHSHLLVESILFLTTVDTVYNFQNILIKVSSLSLETEGSFVR